MRSIALAFAVALATAGLTSELVHAGIVTYLDDDDPGYSEPVGAWGGEGGVNMYNGDENYSNSAGAQATYSFSGLDDGRYLVYASWGPGGNRTATAAYAVGGVATGRAVDQRSWNSHDIWREVSGADNNSGEGYARVGNTAYVTSGGSLTVDVTKNDSGYIMTDAIRLEKVRDGVAEVFVIDNESPLQNDGTFSTAGSWGTHSGDSGDHRNNLHYGTATDAVATYEFTGLDQGVYRVSANWTGGGNRPTDATYTVGSRTETLNQQVAAAGRDLRGQCVSGPVPIRSGQRRLAVGPGQQSGRRGRQHGVDRRRRAVGEVRLVLRLHEVRGLREPYARQRRDNGQRLGRHTALPMARW